MDYFTLQFFFVLLAGILLGSKLGALAVLLYVVIGLLGLPIFAAGGGLAYIVRPSFGYLIGFIAGAYVTGIICEKTNEIAAKKYVLAVLSGLLATYMIGLGYKIYHFELLYWNFNNLETSFALMFSFRFTR